jgi:DNA adenine methylase
MKHSAVHKKSVSVPRVTPKSVIKWAGGKAQLLPILSEKYPTNLGTKIRHYAEPFIGGGAVFFDVYNKGLIDSAVLMDSNPALINLYQSVKIYPDFLIEILQTIQTDYFNCDPGTQEKFFYDKRNDFNRHTPAHKIDPVYAAQFIFLNRTCFNGLFRVNKSGFFNVPFGRYKNPRILDSDNIYAVSNALQIADIIHGDFEILLEHIRKNAFIYYDPPYKPITKTSHFTAYSGEFNDNDQIRLHRIFSHLHDHGMTQMLVVQKEQFDLYNKFQYIPLDNQHGLIVDYEAYPSL